MKYCVLNKWRKFGAKIFLHYTDVVIFMLGYLHLLKNLLAYVCRSYGRCLLVRVWQCHRYNSNSLHWHSAGSAVSGIFRNMKKSVYKLFACSASPNCNFLKYIFSIKFPPNIARQWGAGWMAPEYHPVYSSWWELTLQIAVTVHFFRQNHSRSASNSACSCTFLHNVVCLSVVCHTRARVPCLTHLTDLDVIWQEQI